MLVCYWLDMHICMFENIVFTFDQVEHAQGSMRIYIYLDLFLKFWGISTTNMTYTRSQNYANMVVGEREIQTSEVVVVVVLLLLLSFDVCVSTSAHPLLLLDKWYVQIYLNVRYSLNPHILAL